MRLVGLNGLTIWPFIDGTINTFYTDGIFPYRWNWRQKDITVINSLPREDYVLTGFSDGGTLCHEIAQKDEYCKGLMVVSSLFRYPTVERDIPILLIRTEGEVKSVFESMLLAEKYYQLKGVSNVKLVTTEYCGRFKHQYRHTLHYMYAWCYMYLNYQLPIKA